MCYLREGIPVLSGRGGRQGPATSKAYFGMQFYIEDLLGPPVDLVTDKALRKELRPHIEREIINI